MNRRSFSFRRFQALLVSSLLVLSIAPAASGSGSVGRVVDLDGDPLAGATLTAGEVAVVTDEWGRFDTALLPAGEVTVERPAFASRTVQWDGATSWFTVRMAPRIVRGIHVAGWTGATDGDFQRMLDIGAATSVNALVLDIKNENGKVYSRSAVPTVAEIGAQASENFDLGERTRQAHAQDFYVITRIVTFQDPIAARAHPSWAVTDASTGMPLTKNGQVFLDPTDPNAGEYALELAVEACRAGVDEVQFDYVRFPDGAGPNARYDGPSTPAARASTIVSFLAEAKSRLLPMGCATAADIFGWITNTPTEGGIGQHFESIADVVDVVSPMIYPSHYSSGWYGFDVPNDHPGEVVTAASRDALGRMDGTTVVLRPWLQDFWYTPAQVREQIVAVDGLNLGWMLWNILSEFTVAGIPVSSELIASEFAPPVGSEPPPLSGFWDVPDTSAFSADVAWLAASGITRGCNPPWNDEFCPEDPVTRGEMAAFLVRALDLATTPNVFDDATGSLFEAEIGALAGAGVTRGCNPPANTNFCPETAVTRGEMAAFLVRAFSYPATEPVFVDIGRSVFAAEIGALAAAGVTKGCDPPINSRFCPDDPVTRQEMAAFLHRAHTRSGGE